MWFDEIMDDCKQALFTANKYKGIFIPIFLKLAYTFALVIFIVFTTIGGIARYRYILNYVFTDAWALREVLPSFLIGGLIFYLLILIGYSIIDVGSLNMFKLALSDVKPTFRDFREGIRNYLIKVILGKLFLHVLILIVSPLLIFLYLLYALLVGTLTAGWGITFLAVFVSVFLGTWISIIVLEGVAPLEAIGKSISLGRRYFKGLFVILLAASLIGSYSVSIFGILAAVLGGWFIAGIVSTYFKLVILLIYYRNKEQL